MRITSLILMLAASFGFLVGGSNAQTSQDEPIQTEACSYVGSMPTRFSSAEEDDRLTVQIIGNGCDQPYLAVTISNSDDEVLYSHGFPALWASYDCGPVENCAQWVFEGAMVPAYTFSESDLPPLEQALQDDLYFNVNEDAYAYAQTEDRPLFCYQNGKSMGDCIVFMNGRAVLTHSSGT